MNLHILGIRHHGTGSAQYVLQALKDIQPDCLLIEGAPDANAIIAQAQTDMQPPVAILVYNKDLPKQASFYPFAAFSPEWVAIQYALQHQINVQFMDLPLAIAFAQKAAEEQCEMSTNQENGATNTESVEQKPAFLLINDYPLDHLAQIAGYTNTDLWWEHYFEQHQPQTPYQQHFQAVDIAMNSLREVFNDPPHNDLHNQQREAYMRHIIRQTANAMYTNIVVVCGAWHAPALRQYHDKAIEKKDKELLKALPKPIKTDSTWMPWTYSRLSMKSGYGAGILSPGWYEHLWKYPNDRQGHRWLTNVARLLRKKNMDISTAHIIEAARLAEALAAMRQRPRPGLQELNEATQSTICFGDSILMQLIDKELIVSEKMGKVPDNLPKPPIQVDFEQKIKSLRLPLSEDSKELTLDLRNNNDLLRSHFLYTLQILEIPLARSTYSRSRGTFKEAWQLRWKPEMVIALIDKGIWGNTLADAATAFLQHQSQAAQSVKVVSNLISQAIPAALYAAIDSLKDRLDEVAAVGSDIQDLLASLSPLVSVTRYGDVRQTDSVALLQVVGKLLERICIGLATACYSLDKENALKMLQYINTAHEAVLLLEQNDLQHDWLTALAELSNNESVNPATAGCAVRLLSDMQQLSEDQTALYFSRALSVGTKPDYAADWLEGFLKNSGDVILYDAVLWHLLHKWVCELPEESFTEQLPILRRTFSKFEKTQRRMIGEKARQTVLGGNDNSLVASQNLPIAHTQTLNTQRAEQVLPLIWQILAR